MAIFKYEALGQSGDFEKGTYDAKSREEVEKWLLRRRLRPQKVSRDWTQIEITKAKVKNIEIVVFTRQLAAMTTAGLSITRALDIMAEQVKNRTLQKAVSEMVGEINQGEELSHALKQHPDLFPSLYVNMVAAGEVGGNLSDVLERLATYMEESDDLQRKVKGAMVYPISVLAITYLAVVVLLYFVIPNFESMFSGLDNLPFITSVNIKLSHFMRDYPHIFFGGTFAALWFVKYCFGNKKIRKSLDQVAMRMPIIGPIIVKGATARFARTLATLLGNGVKLPEALQLTADAAGNIIVQRAIEEARKAVFLGNDLTTPLKESRVFEPMVTQLVRVGEESGELDAMLDKIADFYEADVRRTVEAATKMIEPIMMAFIGVVIGGILMSVYLPMFDSMLSVGQ